MSELLASEVAKLAPERTLVETEDFSVLLAKAREIPNVLHEIGRLREVTFRQVGEGTGKPIDLDRFDDHYWHLFVWNRHTNEVVGAYRLGPSDEILGASVLRVSTPASCSTGSDRFWIASVPRLSWAGPSCVRNIRRPTRRCCCYGKASGSFWFGIRNTNCFSAR